MMANLQAVAHGRLLSLDGMDGRATPSGFVDALNRHLHGRFGDYRYATMIYGEYDSRSKVLRYVNAGHCAPIVISESGELTKLTEGDLPVGLFPDVVYRELEIQLSSGSAIVLYTDGLTDALSAMGEEFGEHRVMSCLRSMSNIRNSESICTLLAEAVIEWAKGVEQFDDTTILVLSAE